MVMGFRIKQELELLKALAPVGSTPALQSKLAAVLVDASALPGTYVSAENALEPVANDSALDGLAAALVGLSRADALARGDVVRDTLWARAKRNSMNQVKSAESLQRLSDEVAVVDTVVMENMVNEVSKVLLDAFWSESDAMNYCVAGGLPNISRWTLAYYKELLLQCLARVNSLGWAVVAVDVKYYSDELHLIRTTSTTRFTHLVKTYVFLRDARRDSYMTHKQLSNRVASMNKIMCQQMDRPGGGGGGGAAAGRRSCARCHGTFHQDMPSCPLDNMSFAKSRLAAKAVQAKIDAGTTAAVAIKEVRESLNL